MPGCDSGAVETAAPPVNTALPSISGTAANGQASTCNPGTFTEGPTLAFAWLSDGAVAGSGPDVHDRRCGTARHRDPVPGDRDELQGLDGGDRRGGRCRPSRLPPPPTPPAAPVNTVRPSSPEGPADRPEAHLRAGHLLECDTRSQRAWLRNGARVASGTTYTLVAADAGRAIQCQVTATGAGGTVVAESAPRVSAKACIVPRSSARPWRPRRGAEEGQLRDRQDDTEQSTKKAGNVIATSPAKGNNLAAGTKVALTVAKK